MRFKNNEQYESEIDIVDKEYNADDSIFTGYIYKLNTPACNKVDRPSNEKAMDFKQVILEFLGHNCFILTSGYCFIKCIKYLTGGDYKKLFLDFTRDERRRSNVMTRTRIQPFL